MEFRSLLFITSIKIFLVLLIILLQKPGRSFILRPADAAVGTQATTTGRRPLLLEKSTTSVIGSTTRLFYILDLPPDDGSGLSYEERSRPFRRDVFTHDDWVRHRSSDRFASQFVKFFRSGIVRALAREIILTTSVSILVCVGNALLATGYNDAVSGLHHDPWLYQRFGFHLPVLSLPSIFLSLSSPALSLLLVFKTNTSYQRWDEARKNWGAIVNNSRTMMRQATAWVQQQQQQQQHSDLSQEQKHRRMTRLALALWSFSRSLTRHLLSSAEDEKDYIRAIRDHLRPDLAEDLIAARHRPTRALYELSCAIDDLPLSEWRRVALDNAVTTLCDAMGSNERIFMTPVPLFYTRHTSRFLEVWLLLMPLTLYNAFDYTWNHVGMIPATLIISFFLLGIEELGIQLEEPFSLLPMHKITNGIGLSAQEHVEWMLKDDNNYQNGTVNNTIHHKPFGFEQNDGI